MFNFGVEVSGRDGQPVTALGDVSLRGVSWSGAASGGPKAAEIEATGSRSALKSVLLNWLMYRVTVTTPSGGPCWWGYVHEIALSTDGVEIVASLDTLRNRVAITYTSLEGAVESALVTAWAEDAVSQGDYGIFEHYESLGQASTAMATAYRDRLLARDAWPRLTRSLGQGGGLKATLRCRGWTALMGRRYYLRTDGRLEHMPSDTLVQPIGWGVTASNQIGFGDSGIHDAWGRLGEMAAGMKLAVTGSVGNNKTFTVLEGTSEQVENYSNNSIYFQPTDDILDALAGMGMVKSEHWLLVSGSAANSRWHRIGQAAADHLRTSASVSGAIVNETTGPSISMYQAQKLSTVETAAYEAPGAANVTIQHHGQQVAQRFTLAAPMKLDRVMVEAAKVGAPSGSLQVRIHADSGGAVGALLTSGSLAAAALTGNMAAVWVPVTEITLAVGNYWIVVRRSDSNDGQLYFLVGMTATAYGTCQMWTGSAWVAHAPGWFLKFRLWAVEDTGTMAEAVLTATAQGVTVQGGFLSGVNGFPTMDAQAVALDEVTRLVGVGMSDGRRALLDVSPDLQLQIVAQPQADPATMLTMRTTGGKIALFDSAGSPWPPGVLPAGMWAELADIDSDLTAVGGLSPAFIEEATYDPAANSWEIGFEGERSLADLLKVQAG